MSGQQPLTLKMTKHNPASALYYSPNQVRYGEGGVGIVLLIIFLFRAPWL